MALVGLPNVDQAAVSLVGLPNIDLVAEGLVGLFDLNMNPMDLAASWVLVTACCLCGLYG